MSSKTVVLPCDGCIEALPVIDAVTEESLFCSTYLSVVDDLELCDLVLSPRLPAPLIFFYELLIID